MSNVAVMDPRPSLAAGARLQAIVPRDMNEAYRLGKAICLAGMAPEGMNTPEKCMLAIMHGLEIGLPPLMAVQRIAIIGNRPAVWGDAVIGLVRGSGLCLYINETITGEGDARTATCETKRKGEPRPVIRTYSVSDAKRAMLWDERPTIKKRYGNEWKELPNKSPWHTTPDRMLAMRARGFCLRDTYADVLGGLYLREELEGLDDQRLPEPISLPAQIDHEPDDGLFDEARLKAQGGSRAFAEWLYAQPVEQRERLWDINDELEALMAHADAEQGEMEPA